MCNLDKDDSMLGERIVICGVAHICIAQSTDALLFLQIQERFGKWSPENPDGARELKTSEDMTDWNDGKIQIAVTQPASTGHGLNLQHGGSTIVWFGLNWSLELYEQANARLWRQGQKHTVVVHHLVVKGTMDEQVVKALHDKAADQNALLAAVKARMAAVAGVGEGKN